MFFYFGFKLILIDTEMTYEDDSQLLQMVETYCLTAKSRQTVKSGMKVSRRKKCVNINVYAHMYILWLFLALLECPQVLIAEEEKIIVEEIDGGQTVVEEK